MFETTTQYRWKLEYVDWGMLPQDADDLHFMGDGIPMSEQGIPKWMLSGVQHERNHPFLAP